MADFTTQRRMMVDGQIRTADVTDRALLGAFLAVPRERFVPEPALAYLDRDLPLSPSGKGARCMLKPMLLAKMLQALEIGEGQTVLAVGCNTGYAAALLARLGAAVTALEEDAALAGGARANLAKLAGVEVVQGRLADGHAAAAPYDAILVEGRVETAPDSLCRQLAPGGRLVCIQGEGAASKVMLYRRDAEGVSARAIFDGAAPVLPGFARPAAFVF